MADPMTQSHQISSSQGLNDGHAKDSKFTDSFFSSSPVSLIKSPQDKRVSLDSDKPSDVVQSSLSSESSNRDRSFREKRELFESSTASQNQDSTPIKVSPVSERIKALEALTAKKNDSDWTDGGLPHCRERYCEKSPTDQHGISSRSSIKKKPKSSDNDSPESPFEILGDSRRGSELEDTADWMRAHLPPAPNFNLREADFEKEEVNDEVSPKETKSKDLQTTNISEPFVGVPAEFMDMPAEEANQINDSYRSRQESVDNESAFDLRFLPTAYMYDKQENSLMEAKDLTCPPEAHVSEVVVSPSPPDDFKAPSQVSSALFFVSNTTQESSALGVGEPAEILEVESSGESDDTVIEDSSGDCHPASTDAPECKTSLNSEALPQKQIIQVPIINVINEPEEQVLSDYEVEQEEDDDDHIYQMHEPMTEVSQQPENNSKSVNVVDNSSTTLAGPDADFSARHKIITDEAEEDQTCLDSNSLDLEISKAHSSVSPNLNSISTESTVNTIKSDKTEEVVNVLPANPKDILNDIESSDIETYLDHYSSEEQDLKDRPNSGIFTENNAKTYELMKSNPVQDSWETTMYDQQSYAKVAVDEFDEMHLESQSNYNLYPKPEPSSTGISITEEVQVESLVSQNKTLSLEFEELCLDIKSTDISSADVSFTKDVHVKPPMSQNNIPSLEIEEQGMDEMTVIEPPFANFSITEETHDEPLVSQNKKISLDLEECLAKKTVLEPSSASFSISEDVQVEPLSSQNKIPSLEEQFLDQKTISASDSFSLVEDNSVTPYSAEENAPALFPSFHNEATDRIADVMSDFAGSDLTKILMTTNPKQEEVDQCIDPDSKLLPEIQDPHESTEPESSMIAATDSFVEFMRECLKSQQDEDSKSLDLGLISQQHIPLTSSCSSTVIDLEQEHPNIHVSKKLGNSQEKDVVGVPKKDIPTSSQAKPSQPSYKLEYSTGSINTAQPLLNELQPDTSLTEEVEAIDIWVAEAYHLAEHVLTLLLTHLSVHDLVYWRDPKKSGVVFGTSLLLLLSLAAFSVISVLSYLLLALLCVTISFRVYKAVVQAVQKTSDGHPFKELMEKDVSLSPESFRKHVDGCLTCINRGLKQMLRLFLVEDLVDSLKLAVFMWFLTYVGAVFNGITILILVDILAFTVPPLYEKYKTQIDHYIDIARTQFNNVAAKIQEKLHKGKRTKAE